MTSNSIRHTLLAFALVSSSALVVATYAQQPDSSTAPSSPEDVIRIKTELVQTEVMVFDRQGRFVQGLRPDQFELNLNGSPQPVTFFEFVTSGSASEAAQIAAASAPGGKARERKADVRASDPGRVIFFFVDDVHLSPASLVRTRKTLQWFVDNQMNTNDQVAIVSTSGQVGLLQQLSDNTTVLHTAISRLHNKQNPETITGKTQISDYMASQVLDYGNRELFASLLESVKVEQQMGPGSRHGDHGLAASYSAVPYLRNRLRQINAQGQMSASDTFSILERLMTSSAGLPGRKLVFFLSDGFIFNERKFGALGAPHRLTSLAAKSGVVVYAMDMRGTFSGLGSGTDASSNGYADLSGRRAGMAIGEETMSQEPLKLIADATGGRAIVNTNAFNDGILAGIRETADYYLLAWRPASDAANDDSSRIEVTVRDRPDLQVRLRNNFYNAAKPISAVKKQSQETDAASGSSDTDLLTTLSAPYPAKGLPVSLSVGYFKLDQSDLTLNLSMQLDLENIFSESEARLQKSEIDVAGVALDDRGQFASFKQVLSLPPDLLAKEKNFAWTQQLRLKPGLYQVRIALLERNTGRSGSAMQWIDLPDDGTSRFAMSSLFLGKRETEASGSPAGPHPISVDVDHRFPRASVLRFQTYVYNAVRGSKGPEVSIQTQVFRNRTQVMNVANGKVPVTSEGPRLPYWSEISLESLPPGRYVLQVTATDQIANHSAVQRINFVVE